MRMDGLRSPVKYLTASQARTALADPDDRLEGCELDLRVRNEEVACDARFEPAWPARVGGSPRSAQA